MRDSHLGKVSKRYETILRNGYVFVHNRSHPNADKQGYVAEHRLVMADHIGRPLRKGEVVHHVNEIPTDNRIENLRLCANSGSHIRDYHPEALKKALKASVGKPLTENQLKALALGRKYWPRGVVQLSCTRNTEQR